MSVVVVLGLVLAAQTAPPPPAVTVALEGESGVVFFARPASGDGEAQPLCAAPCRAQLAPGSYRIGLARGDDAPVEMESPVLVTPDTQALSGEYQSYFGVRIGGALLAAGSVAGLIAGAAVAFDESGQENPARRVRRVVSSSEVSGFQNGSVDTNAPPSSGTGLAIGIASTLGLLAGIALMALVGDDAAVTAH